MALFISSYKKTQTCLNVFLESVQSYIKDHFGSLMANQSWGLEASVSKMTLRSALLEMACSLNICNCTTQAKHLFDQWFTSNKTSQ